MEAPSRIINVEYALLGEDLEIVNKVHLEIEDGVIQHIGKGWISGGETYNRSILLPGLVNAHVHSFDGVSPEYGINLPIKEAVGDPRSEKYRILRSFSERKLFSSTLEFLKRSLSIGVLTVVDFNELDLFGAQIAHKIKKNSPVHYISLGRLDGDFSDERLLALKELVDGYGVSSISLGQDLLKKIKNVFMDRLVAIHISETLNQNLVSDVDVAISTLKPKILIHGTHLTKDEIRLIADAKLNLVICPRSNLWFSVGIPNIPEMIKAGVKLLIGTDNAGITDHNLWKEMEVSLLLSRLKDPGSDFSKEILRSSTINFNDSINPVSEGKRVTAIVMTYSDRFTAALNKYSAMIKDPGNLTKVLAPPRTLS
ncbi:MAG: amidohydrolase family protein [Metallosphaera sp.]|uniref:amidohydrolase family protein n=1 Tax=Metallosphaera sp. TaxID=2020860 RepID=UPI0031688978